MGKYQSDVDIAGQITIEDIFAPTERLFAVSKIFARARKDMSLSEQKAFVYALTQIKFTEPAQKDAVLIDKKTLAGIIGIRSDPDHLSVDLYQELKEMPRHSYIEIAERDIDFYSNGFVITNVTRFKRSLRIKFNSDYLGLFTNLSREYITMWSTDIFQMNHKRSVQFYELLRQMTTPSNLEYDNVYSYGWGIKAFKEMFDIPKEGKGSYMRTKGGFNRDQFERRVLDPICEDLAKTRMVTLILQPDGKYYQKIKRGNRVSHYQFFWEFTARPGIASAQEIRELQERVDKNPQVLKVAKDLIEGQKRPKKPKPAGFTNFTPSGTDWDAVTAAVMVQQEREREGKL